MLLRLLRWVPADLTTLPYSPDVGEVQNFIDGHIIGPKKSNFKLEWDQRPGSGWNYAATQAFTQLFMDESESYDRMLFAHSDLQRQFARRFSYLRIKRKEKLIVQDGTDVEQKKLKEKSLSQLKQRRRANRRKGVKVSNMFLVFLLTKTLVFAVIQKSPWHCFSDSRMASDRFSSYSSSGVRWHQFR